MLELHGRGYVIEHCIAAFRRQQDQQAADRALHVYITDALKTIAENTTHYLIPGVGAVDYGTTLRLRYADLLDMVREQSKEDPEPEDTRSAQEIAADMWTRIRGTNNQE